jgi:hypothetical protein
MRKPRSLRRPLISACVLLCLGVCWRLAAEEPAEFRFPDDTGGKLLEKALTPGTGRSAPEATAPRRGKPPARVEAPATPLPAGPQTIVRLPAPPRSDRLQPRLVTEEVLLGLPADPLLPQLIALTATERTRVPSVDVAQPIALPYLGQPTPDRAPLDDVTKAASAAAAVSAPPPQRQTPVPFQRTALPDPYENRRGAQSESLPDETAAPTSTSPRTPR